MKPNKLFSKEHKTGKHKISIRWKLFAYLTVFICIILIMLWLCQVVFLDDIYKTIKTGEIQNTAHKLTESINSDELETISADLGKKNEVCILIFRMLDADNALRIVSVCTIPDCTIHNMSRESIFILFDSAVRNGGKLLQRFRYDEVTNQYYSITNSVFSNSDDEESIIYTIITSDNKGNDILVILNSVVSPVGATVKTLNYLLIANSMLMIILALILAGIMSKKISKPIIDINKSAKLLGEGNYDVLFKGGNYREISELSETLNYAAAELSKVEGLRRELIANISHDLRTPLTMITGYSEVMRDIPNENTPENVQVIINEARRLTSLVNDLLDISKLQSGNQELTVESVNLTQTLKEGLERYNKFRQQEGYSIDFIYDREIIVSTDKTRFLQAFYNLVNNAITYTGEDKKVIVRQEIIYNENSSAGNVRISVTDTGEGIEPDKLPLIWDRYYKIDTDHRRAAVGNGLGLSIVRKIMDLLGGTCGVESKVGEGSTFWIQL